MPDPTAALAIVLLVALVEASSVVRLPIGLLLAIGLLASDADLLPVALLGAVGVMLARLSLALAARAGRDRIGASSPAQRARREALRRHLASSPSYARMTFTLSALPGIPANFVFPLLGAMRAPLWPALAGTVAGRIPVLALTTAVFTWLGEVVSDGRDQAAATLGMLAVVLLVFRTLGRVDWAHRAATGKWRLRDDDQLVRVATMFGEQAGAGGRNRQPSPGTGPERDDDGEGEIVEGELLGEEVDDDPDGDPPRSSLPPSGRGS